MLKQRMAPFLRRPERSVHMRLDVLVSLLPLYIVSYVHYGILPIRIVLAAMGAAVGFELLGCLLLRKRPTVTDLSALVTGGIIGAVMSPIAPLWLPVVAAGVAILVIKLPFGGNGRNIFNPAAGGLAFVTICFPKEMFTYPDPGKPLLELASAITAPSPAYFLQSGGGTTLSPTNLMLGNFPGPIGGVSILILLASALYLFTRRNLSPFLLFSYLLSAAAGAALFPRVTGEWWTGVLLELCSGYLLFAGIFMWSDPVTSPKHWLGQILYGILAGALVIYLRHVGQFEEGVCFAILLLNPVAPAVDRLGWRIAFHLGEWGRRIRAGVSE